jgi:hypothetical protein
MSYLLQVCPLLYHPLSTLQTHQQPQIPSTRNQLDHFHSHKTNLAIKLNKFKTLGIHHIYLGIQPLSLILNSICAWISSHAISQDFTIPSLFSPSTPQGLQQYFPLFQYFLLSINQRKCINVSFSLYYKDFYALTQMDKCGFFS